jgi:hypothetical protein
MAATSPKSKDIADLAVSLESTAKEAGTTSAVDLGDKKRIFPPCNCGFENFDVISSEFVRGDICLCKLDVLA